MTMSTILDMISTTAKYALRAVVFLAGNDEGYSSRVDIAETTMVPHDYLLKVLNELDSAGIVESRRGPGGGYRLTSPPDKTTALQVVLAVDEIPRIKECPLGITDHVRLCPLHELLDQVSGMVEDSFRTTKISDLLPGRKRSISCEFPKKRKN